jgi:hypothetical protein
MITNKAATVVGMKMATAVGMRKTTVVGMKMTTMTVNSKMPKHKTNVQKH